MTQPPLPFDASLPLNAPRFDGSSFEPAHDAQRLSGQLTAVRELMQRGAWWTIDQLVDALRKRGLHCTYQGCSARIRDLRKTRFGGHVIDRRRVVGGVFEYRMER